MSSIEQTISILFACGSTMASELYTQALNGRAGFQVVASATSVEEVLQAAGSSEIDIALLAVSLMDGPRSGLMALQGLEKSGSAIKPIILLDDSDPQVIVAAFQAGARGVFSPGMEGIDRLCRCVAEVYAGQVWANSTQLAHVMEAAATRRAPLRVLTPHGTRLLTKREGDVVCLVGEGYTNREIARELRLSEHTVRNNLFRIFDKLGVSTRVELALYAANASRKLLSADIESSGASNSLNAFPKRPVSPFSSS